MRIYILRHEDRTQDCSFFAPLTQKGLENSVDLIEKLKECNINLIFCSPFIRTLQTIYPYIKESSLKINLEYSLAEIQHEDIIPKKAAGINLPEYIASSFNYNPEYKSFLKSTDLSYPENIKHVIKRTKQFLRDIINKYYDTDYNIVLVTHQSICNTLLTIVNKNSEEFKNKLSNDTINTYEKGKLCLVYNNGWTYKPIN